jgi:hypothetical protein
MMDDQVVHLQYNAGYFAQTDAQQLICYNIHIAVQTHLPQHTYPLQRKSHLCIPRKGIAWLLSQTVEIQPTLHTILNR